jgi:hypothetical protein
MNPKILEILPKKIEECLHQTVNSKQLCYRCIDVNDTIDEVTEALKKNEVCVCPSEEEIYKILKLPITTDDMTKEIRKLILEGV